jgi:hypothetical protein
MAALRNALSQIDQPMCTYRHVNWLYHKESSVSHVYDTINIHTGICTGWSIYHNESSVHGHESFKIKKKITDINYGPQENAMLEDLT